MVNLNLKFDQGVPQYVSNSCSNCTSICGNSLCSIKNRGCCWYFPKFTLHEIHKMVKSKEGLEVLHSILRLPKVKICNYYIHAVGYFDEAGYKRFLEKEDFEEFDVKDKSIFFRACPFVEEGKGCTLPKRYRSYVCNFFICDEIKKTVEKHAMFNNYIKERNSYVKWIDWENNSLESLLKEHNINLVNNLNGVINLLKDIPLENYEFINLLPIDEENKFNIGA